VLKASERARNDLADGADARGGFAAKVGEADE
jgi:hypothetical protein